MDVIFGFLAAAAAGYLVFKGFKRFTAVDQSPDPPLLPPPEPSGLLILVACCAKKQATPAPAMALYQSPWFRKARRHAEERGRGVADSWRILSAKHGVVHSETVIEPYEMTLSRMSKAAREEWGKRVCVSLASLIDSDTEVVILAGVQYREHIVPWLHSDHAKHTVTVEVPMEGMIIGKQLRWLQSETNRLEANRVGN